MLFSYKNFVFFDFTGKKFLFQGIREGASALPPAPFSLLSWKLRLRTHHHARMKNWTYNQFMPHKGFLLQVARASYINYVLTSPACKFLNFFILKIKLINLPNIHFPILHLYLLHVIRFPFNIFTTLLFYFQTIHILLPFRKPCFNLFLNFSFCYSLNKVSSFSGFLMCINMKVKNWAFRHTVFPLISAPGVY